MKFLLFATADGKPMQVDEEFVQLLACVAWDVREWLRDVIAGDILYKRCYSLICIG